MDCSPSGFSIQGILSLFFFSPFIFISWRLITLQYCSGFCPGWMHETRAQGWCTGGYSSLQCRDFSLQWLLMFSQILGHLGYNSCHSWTVESRLSIVAHGLSCSMACEIFLDQRSNPCSLNSQADAYPLCHQGSPKQFSPYICN